MAPSLANGPTEKGFYLLLTRLKVAEVLYVDTTLLDIDADITRLKDGKVDEVDCILPANIKQMAAADDKGRSIYSYALSLPGGASIPPEIVAKKEFVLIFYYVNMYPIQGLCLSSFTAAEDIDKVRKICNLRKKK